MQDAELLAKMNDIGMRVNEANEVINSSDSDTEDEGRAEGLPRPAGRHPLAGPMSKGAGTSKSKSAGRSK